ncbi:MAG: hypothetical protein H6Q39_573 [Chloroflexi bacterium]|nr:hypothetical protein [Chloroflexota bacterium]
MGTIAGVMAAIRPNKNIVAARLKKLWVKALKALKRPAKIQTMVSVRFNPKRSAINPEGRLMNIPARGSIPQMVPIETKLKLRSREISGKRTGRHILSRPAMMP